MDLASRNEEENNRRSVVVDLPIAHSLESQGPWMSEDDERDQSLLERATLDHLDGRDENDPIGHEEVSKKKEIKKSDTTKKAKRKIGKPKVKIAQNADRDRKALGMTPVLIKTIEDDEKEKEAKESPKKSPPKSGIRKKKKKKMHVDTQPRIHIGSISPKFGLGHSPSPEDHDSVPFHSNQISASVSQTDEMQRNQGSPPREQPSSPTALTPSPFHSLRNFKVFGDRSGRMSPSSFWNRKEPSRRPATSFINYRPMTASEERENLLHGEDRRENSNSKSVVVIRERPLKRRGEKDRVVAVPVVISLGVQETGETPPRYTTSHENRKGAKKLLERATASGPQDCEKLASHHAKQTESLSLTGLNPPLTADREKDTHKQASTPLNTMEEKRPWTALPKQAIIQEKNLTESSSLGSDIGTQKGGTLHSTILTPEFFSIPEPIILKKPTIASTIVKKSPPSPKKHRIRRLRIHAPEIEVVEAPDPVMPDPNPVIEFDDGNVLSNSRSLSPTMKNDTNLERPSTCPPRENLIPRSRTDASSFLHAPPHHDERERPTTSLGFADSKDLKKRISEEKRREQQRLHTAAQERREHTAKKIAEAKRQQGDRVKQAADALRKEKQFLGLVALRKSTNEMRAEMEADARHEQLLKKARRDAEIEFAKHFNLNYSSLTVNKGRIKMAAREKLTRDKEAPHAKEINSPPKDTPKPRESSLPLVESGNTRNPLRSSSFSSQAFGPYRKVLSPGWRVKRPKEKKEGVIVELPSGTSSPSTVFRESKTTIIQPQTRTEIITKTSIHDDGSKLSKIQKKKKKRKKKSPKKDAEREWTLASVGENGEA